MKNLTEIKSAKYGARCFFLTQENVNSMLINKFGNFNYLF